MAQPGPLPARRMKGGGRVVLWLAQGLGAGRLRPAPGTWGSLVGVAWTLALLVPGSPAWYGLGALAGVALAIPACGFAEAELGEQDPPSVVLDEVVAMPLAFGGTVALWAWSGAGVPGLSTWQAWCLHLALAFGLFRVLDIWKPWPIRRVQRLPGGWGVVLDDVAAGVGAGLLLLLGTQGAFLLRLVAG